MNVSHINFLNSIEVDGCPVGLVSLFEGISQGGPVIGKLQVNGEILFSNEYFSGPMLAHEGSVYLPKLKNRFFGGAGFVLVSVNIVSKRIETISPWHPMVLLKKVDKNVITYFTDIENLNEKRCGI